MKPDLRPAGKPPSALLDRIGATGSLVCAVHCAALPLLIALLPSLGIATWLGDDFERGFVIFASLFHFQRSEFFEADEADRAVPRVQF